MRSAVSAILLALAPLALAQPATQPVKPAFVIGVFSPPIGDMGAWRARSANTVVGYEREGGRVTMDEWIAVARRHGLFTIRPPHDDLATDLADPYLLALMHGDEPELKGLEPAVLATEYAAWKKSAPSLPVFLNISGGNLLFRKTPREQYQAYFKAADWIANDFYPVTGWNQPTWLPRVGQAVDLCRELSDGKPQFAFIETSSQQLAWLPKNSRGPTADEVRAEIWDAVIHGVRGIIYFPQQFNPFKFDATPSSVSVELAKQDRLIEKLGNVLASPVPNGLKVTVSPPLEATCRVGSDGTAYAIVLNLSPETQNDQRIELTAFPQTPARVLTRDDESLTTEGKSLTSSFPPYAIAIYAFPPPPQSPK
jgi:hypothetical protein